jgi:hypothetical protein
MWYPDIGVLRLNSRLFIFYVTVSNKQQDINSNAFLLSSILLALFTQKHFLNVKEVLLENYKILFNKDHNIIF